MASTYYRTLNGIRVQQSEATAARRTFTVEFPAYSSATGTETITVTVSKGGAAFAATAGTTLAKIEGAAYKLTLHATDLDTLGDLAIKCVGTTDTTIYTGLQVVGDDPYTATAAAVWQALVDDYKALAGSYGKWINDIRQASWFGKHDGDTSDNTVNVYDTDGTTALTEVTKSTVGTVTTWTPNPLT